MGTIYNMLKILFIGDIVGYLGREAVKKILPKIKLQHNPHLTIANAENLAHGKGVTKETIKEMGRAGIDFFTSGNHVFAKKEAGEILSDRKSNLLRPANYPPKALGSGDKVINISQKKILLLNLMGRVFINEDFDCPFRKFDSLIKKHKNLNGVIVDFHAEATSEKMAFASYVEGRAAAVLGTHTHVQTADERILKKGTAFISDVGMVGGLNSIIGINKEGVIKTFLTQIKQPHELPRKGECVFSAVLININTKNKTASKIERISKKIIIK